MAKAYLRINLSRIPKELMRKADNNDMWVSLNVTELREVDEKGNNVCVSVYVPKDKRKDDDKPIYIGRGQLHENSPRENSRPENSPRRVNEGTVNEENDLPFNSRPRYCR